jgi:hypothetical protein
MTTFAALALFAVLAAALMLVLDRIVARQNRRAFERRMRAAFYRLYDREEQRAAEQNLDAAWDAVTRDVNRRVREDREAWQRESRRDGWAG